MLSGVDRKEILRRLDDAAPDEREAALSSVAAFEGWLSKALPEVYARTQGDLAAFRRILGRSSS